MAAEETIESQFVLDELDKLSTMIGKDIKKAEQQDTQDLLNLSAQAKQAQSDIDNRADILERQIQDTDKQLSNLYQKTDKEFQEYEQQLTNGYAEVDQLLSGMEWELE